MTTKKKPQKTKRDKKEEEIKKLKGLKDINRHIFTEKFGEKKAKEMMDEIEKLEKIHHAPRNKLPV